MAKKKSGGDPNILRSPPGLRRKRGTFGCRNRDDKSPHPQQQEQPLFPIVGVGASAGGLEAFTAFLKHVPPDSGMAFVLIQHLDPKQPSQLTDLLSKATRMPIHEVKADIPVKPNHVYVIAPGVSLSMSDAHLRVEKRVEGRHLPIDYFLRSLAGDNTSKAIGIILSGTASDGTLGLKAVKAVGGVTFAQEPSSAKFDGMPSSAIAAGVVDFVLPPEEIAKRLVRLAQHPYVPEKSGDDSETAKETETALNRIFYLLHRSPGMISRITSTPQFAGVSIAAWFSTAPRSRTTTSHILRSTPRRRGRWRMIFSFASPPFSGSPKRSKSSPRRFPRDYQRPVSGERHPGLGAGLCDGRRGLLRRDLPDGVSGAGRG